jgi:hypothetical protein
MSDQSPHTPDRSLAEISHLFLSAVRDKAGGPATRPQRTPPPPPKIAVSIDLTPEEFAQVAGGDAEDDAQPASRGSAPVPPITAVIGGHLNGKQFDRVKQYARHLAANGKRVGLIEVDASEFRVFCFDKHPADAPVDPEAHVECSFDPRRMNEVLEELSWDVERWLLVLPTPRVPESRALLRDCPKWVLLSTCDHDGVIACYRTLKGLTDLWPGGPSPEKPSLALALLDASDPDHAERVSAKLTSVCQQFLSWPLEAETTVTPEGADAKVGEHLVMCCRSNRDKGQVATAPQWQIVAEFVARSTQVASAVASAKGQATAATEMAAAPARETLTEISSVPRSVPMQLTETIADTKSEKTDTADVIDLPTPETGESGIVEAILRHCSGELVECPVTPPMCPRAKLAVGRDHRVVLLAVARQGLADLNTIGQAYRWLQENQNLIGMAVPQLSIDTQQQPHLSLLINQADSTAQTLQPMLEGAHVTVKTYRKLRWGGKTGLLLEAA